MTELPLTKRGRQPFGVANQAVREAGGVVMAHFRGEKRIEYKGRTDLVTDVDLLVEEKMIALLQKEYPSFGIITEESEEIAGDSPYTWIIDPIDGTRNFARGIPHFSVALALTQGDEVLLGIVYDPLREEFFWAEKGGGAFLNNSPISVSKKTSLEASLIGFDMGYDAERGQEVLDVASALWPGVQSVRVMGSAALGLAYAACGRLDLYLHLSLFPWDLASGILLINEAGGRITETDGKPISIRSKRVIATNAVIHEEFMGRIRGRA